MIPALIPALVIRPEPGCSTTVAALQTMRVAARGAPLFAVTPIDWTLPEPASYDALLIGSANALRHGGAELAALRGRPTYAVGATTADAARAAGLEVIATGEGGLQALLAHLAPAHRRLLRLSGRERIELEPPPGITISQVVVYASDPLPMPPEAARALRQPAVIVLHSGEAARHFAGQCDALAIDRSQLHLAAIGSRVLAAAGPGWASVRAAPRPEEQALLALAYDMCQTSHKPD